MSMRLALAVALLAPALLLAACDEDDAPPRPAAVAITSGALSYYCRMQVGEHSGPKAQIHLSGMPEPIFFAQVRDAVAYLRQPERTAPIAAIYVSDMGSAPSWDAPGDNNWTDAETAFFVVGSDAVGGMGAPEVVPFADQAAATDFAARRGGAVMRLSEIPAKAVLGAVDINLHNGG